MKLAPILLFTYNRLFHLKQTVEALQRNYKAKESALYFFSDASKDGKTEEEIAAVRKYLFTVNGFKKTEIIQRKEHLGLAKSVIKGVSELFEEFDKLIILEDDLVTSRNFIVFMNNALEVYSKNPRIFSVTGYNHPIHIPKRYKPPVYLSPRCSSWGWGTWKDRWEKVDWEMKGYEVFKSDECAQNRFSRGGQDLLPMLDYQMRGYIDSWAIRWCYAHYKNNADCLYPVISKVKNIGLDRSGTHKTKMNIRITLDKSDNTSFELPKDIRKNKEILRNFSAYFKKSPQTVIKGLVKKMFFPVFKLLKTL